MIILILILGLILRLITINQSLWLDESINVLAAKDLGFWHFVTGYPIGDFHPPLYFALLWVWSHLFGFSEIAVRLPSVILGLITIYITFLIGKDFFSKKVGLVAALLLALGPLHVYYSQEARMYSLACFSVTLSSYLFLKFLQKGNLLNGFWYGISLILVLYSDYIAYFIIPVHLAYILFFERKRIKKLWLPFLISAVSFSPWALLIFPQQLENGRLTAVNVPGWAKVVGGSNFKSLVLVFIKTIIGRITLVNKQLYAILGMGLLAIYWGIILLNLKKINEEEEEEKHTKFLFLWLLIPILGAFLFSFFIPVLSYFRLLFILPGFYLLVARGLDLLSKRVSNLLLALLIFTASICLFFYYTNPNFQREDWKGIAGYLNSLNPQTSLIIFEDNGLPAPFKYYDQKKVEAIGGLNHFPASSSNDLIDLKIKLSGKEKIYLVDYLVQIADPQREIDRKLTSLGWRVYHISDFPGVGFVYEYTK